MKVNQLLLTVKPKMAIVMKVSLVNISNDVIFSLDLAPTSQSSHTVSFVVSVSCTIGVIALVVVIVLTMYAMRRQKQALRKK